MAIQQIVYKYFNEIKQSLKEKKDFGCKTVEMLLKY